LTSSSAERAETSGLIDQRGESAVQTHSPSSATPRTPSMVRGRPPETRPSISAPKPIAALSSAGRATSRKGKTLTMLA